MQVLNINVTQTLPKVAVCLFTGHLVLALRTLHLVGVAGGSSLILAPISCALQLSAILQNEWVLG